jgi:uncharacterized protein (TIGR02996 family)
MPFSRLAFAGHGASGDAFDTPDGMNEDAFLCALHENPSDEVTWLALADWLDEHGQADRAELVRISRQLRPLPVMQQSKERAAVEKRLVALLDAGVKPVVPQLVNSIGLRLCLLPAGRFRMGSPQGSRHRRDEPAHEVTLTRPFYLGAFLVTQAQYKLVMGNNPSAFSPEGQYREKVAGLDTSDFPVEQAIWEEATEFCQRLTQREAKDRPGWAYRLPTEAEWEHACRAGTTTAFHSGASLSMYQANGDAGRKGRRKALGRPSAVGSYRPNAFGLYDMHGNVWEWCSDWFGQYKPEPRTDPRGPSGTYGRTCKGGSWRYDASCCRAANRSGTTVTLRSDILGFRVALVRTD